MDLIQQLDADLSEAMKLRDEVRVTTLRLIKSALKNYQIELGHDLTLQEAMKVLQKEAKKHQDSIDSYKKANRSDLVSQEEAELKVINKYLPKQKTETELVKLVKEAISDVKASTPADIGKVISAVRKVEPTADGSILAHIAKEELNK